MRSKGLSLLVLIAADVLPVGGDRLLGDGLSPAFGLDALDPDRCAAWRDDQPGWERANKPTLLHVLGIENAADHRLQRWAGPGGYAREGQPAFYFRIVYRKPQPIGTLLCPSRDVRYLRPGAAMPEDPAHEDWIRTPPWPGQSGMPSTVFPPGLKTTAVLLAESLPGNRWPPTLDYVRFFETRLLNVCPIGFANASEEYTPPAAAGGPRTPPMKAESLITGGWPPWQNAGVDKEGFVRRADIDASNPVWITLSWREPQEVVGLRPFGECGGFQISAFAGPDNVPPNAGTRREWKKLPYEASPDGVLQFRRVRTRGIRLTITRGMDREPKIARLHGLHAYRDLGDQPLPPFPKKSESRPPVRIPYDMPHEGLFALVIDDARGRRVRNLLAMVKREPGPQEEGWDGKDMDGQYVPPGTYRWKAITSKPLELHYQFTVYPNITRNTPWITSLTGPGGWLADHTPPTSVCTWGDRVWLGALVAESGVSFIECDLRGQKIAGWHSFDAWTGPRHLATDGRTVFIAHPKENLDPIWGYDPKTREVRPVLQQATTETRRTGLVGMAARDGKLYLSIRGKSAWLDKPFGAPNVDIENCVPRYAPARKPRKAYEIVPKPQEDFLRLFRLMGVPPGMGSIGLNLLETPEVVGRTAHIVLAFHQPQSIGSAVFPVPKLPEGMKFYLSVLKPDGPYPPNPSDKSQWIVLEASGRPGWDCIPFPRGTQTRALRITWERSGDDPLAEVEEDFGDSRAKEGEISLGEMGIHEGEKPTSKGWKMELEGMSFLRRRYENVHDRAAIKVSSGTILEDGTWDAQRKKPLSTADPAVYAMEWPEEVSVRGVAIKEIDGARTLLDVYTGPPDAAIDPAAADGWTLVGEYIQSRRDHHSGFESFNAYARYMDGTVDFGKQYRTRALRLRVVEQWSDYGDRQDMGLRPDLGGRTLDPARCRIWGVAALSYLGGEDEVDSRQTERIAVYNEAQKKYETEMAIEQPGDIAFGPSGDLFAISGRRVVKVNFSKPEDASVHTAVIEDLAAPQVLTLDQQGRFYVFDAAADRQVIRIYDRAGQFVKTWGTPGGRVAGPWTGGRFTNVTAMAVDREGSLWVVEYDYWPKRVSKWSPEGVLLHEFFGPTQYGGAGVLDPYDKTRFYYQPLEFELDWEKGTSRLKNLTWRGNTPAGEIPILYKGRRYMVTRGEFANQGVAVVYLYETDHLKLAAALGRATAFDPLKRPELLAGLGNIALPEYRFTWSDLDGDGAVQAQEVRLQKGIPGPFGLFNAELRIHCGPLLYKIKEVLPHGVPVWEEESLPKTTSLQGFATSYQPTLDGHVFLTGVWNAVVRSDGEVLWKYRTEGVGVQALHHAPPYAPGQVAAEFGNISHPATMDAPREGELGAFEVHHSNPGAWNIWTHDGLLAGHLFRDQRHPGTPFWGMTEHHRGLRLDNHTPGQEHFNGYFCRASDGKYYMVAGHNHASLIEVKGLETFKRLSGEISLTADGLRNARNWEVEQQKQKVFAEAPVYDLYKFKAAPKIDGDSRDWDFIPPAALDPGGLDEQPPAEFKMAYDDARLYLFYSVRNSPLRNSGGDWRALFKTGASVDLQMGLDPAAPRDREAPAEGDIRLLITFVQDKPIAVLYRPVVPGTPPDKAYEVVSPVGRTVIDEVRRIEKAEAARGAGNGYTLEAAIPLDEIGFQPRFGERYRLDWGILTTDDYGNTCTGRLYWSNKATAILADAPSEARLLPHLWGDLRVNEFPKSGPADLQSLSNLGERSSDTTDDIDVEQEFQDE
ncbi:MAG: hypothetical protein HYU36_06870 [Planctomycetes bacterium]|nr:hypothetical protein [Planctomycetota bacterium]